jgi:hypothetical protein
MAEEHEEIEVIDVTLSEDEIDEMIAHLMELKEHKTNVQFPLASDLDLSVTFTNEEADEEEHVEEQHVESDKQMSEVKQ